MNAKSMWVWAIGVFVIAAAAHGGILDRVRDAAREAVQEVTGEKAEAPAAPAGPGQVPAGSAASGGGSHPGPSAERREYYPSVSYATLLNGVTVHYRHHKFALDNIQATFIEEGATGYIILRKADGTELYRYDFRAQPVSKPYTLLELMGTFDLRKGEQLSGGGMQVDLDGPGAYVLDFYLPAEHFYTFPFTVDVIGSDDPFAGDNWWVTSGDWFDWGYLMITDADPEKNLSWRMWLRRTDKGTTTRLKEDAKVRVEIRGPGGLVCVSRDATRSIGPDWNRWDFDMAHPTEGTTTWGEYFKAKNLLANDGEYTLTVMKNDTLYGAWKFSVAEGRLQHKGRTLRAETDPLRFIEGGRVAWWYCRE